MNTRRPVALEINGDSLLDCAIARACKLSGERSKHAMESFQVVVCFACLSGFRGSND